MISIYPFLQIEDIALFQTNLEQVHKTVTFALILARLHLWYGAHLKIAKLNSTLLMYIENMLFIYIRTVPRNRCYPAFDSYYPQPDYLKHLLSLLERGINKNKFGLLLNVCPRARALVATQKSNLLNLIANKYFYNKTTSLLKHS